MIWCSLWNGIFVWIDFLSVSPNNLSDHLIQFESLASISKSKRSLFTLIWCACTWTIWKKMNSRIFQNKVSPASKLLDNIKLLSFWWLKAKSKITVFDYYRWWPNSLLCAGICWYCFFLCFDSRGFVTYFWNFLNLFLDTPCAGKSTVW